MHHVRGWRQSLEGLAWILKSIIKEKEKPIFRISFQASMATLYFFTDDGLCESLWINHCLNEVGEYYFNSEVFHKESRTTVGVVLNGEGHAPQCGQKEGITKLSEEYKGHPMNRINQKNNYCKPVTKYKENLM